MSARPDEAEVHGDALGLVAHLRGYPMRDTKRRKGKAAKSATPIVVALAELEHS